MVLLAVLCIGWLLAVTAWAELLARPPGRPRRLFYAGLVVTAGMLPLLSNDLFSLLAQASLSRQGQDVFGSAAAYRNSPWFAWIGARWRESPSPYGPVTLLAAWPGALVGSNPFLADGSLKISWGLALVAVFELSQRRFREGPHFQTMLWLNPLLLVEGIGQLHPDLLGALLITTGLLLRRRSPGPGGALSWAMATLCKLNLALTVPWFALVATRTWAQRLRRVAVLAGVFAVVAVLAYAPFWRGPETLAGQWRSLRVSTLVPGGTLVDVAGAVAGALAGEPSHAGRTVEEFDASQQAVRAQAWRIAQAIAALIALAAIVPLGLRLLRRQDEEWLAVATGGFVVAIVTLASPKFQSWYLLAAVPFFALRCPPTWRRWWVWAVGTSVTPEFQHILPRSSPLYVPASLGTLASVVIFLCWFRGRFWAGDREEGAAAAG